MATANLILGDCIEKMKELPANSIDAIITDPPYGLEFMGKEWDSWDRRDHTEESKTNEGVGTFLRASKNLSKYTAGQSFQDWCKLWATECLRVLKSGGFMFAMGGTRTHHRLTCGIEDAGFMIRDELSWVYMQGFPKAQDLGMLIERKLGGNGICIGGEKKPSEYSGKFDQRSSKDRIKYIPTLSETSPWQGWKTPALKPAFEPIVVAQKPVEGSITENVMKYGVGGYNIDECRIECDYTDKVQDRVMNQQADGFEKGWGMKPQGTIQVVDTEKGRYPSNLLMQEECFGKLSKYFLIPKASKGEKNEDLDGEPELTLSPSGVAFNEHSQIHQDRKEGNFHPTVKPISLMQHLIKLTTKPLYTVLDPFLGSGTTAVAALNLNRNVIGIEISEEYMKIAKARIAEEVKQTRLGI